MTEESVEIVRRAYDAYNDRDVDRMLPLIHDECVVYTAIEGRAEPQPFRGHDGVREWIRNESDVWASVRIDDLSLRDLGDDRILTEAVAALRGRESGLELSVPVTTVFELRDGKILSMRSYPDRDEALEAAGLSE